MENTRIKPLQNSRNNSSDRSNNQIDDERQYCRKAKDSKRTPYRLQRKQWLGIVLRQCKQTVPSPKDRPYLVVVVQKIYSKYARGYGVDCLDGTKFEPRKKSKQTDCYNQKWCAVHFAPFRPHPTFSSAINCRRTKINITCNGYNARKKTCNQPTCIYAAKVNIPTKIPSDNKKNNKPQQFGNPKYVRLAYPGNTRMDGMIEYTVTSIATSVVCSRLDNPSIILAIYGLKSATKKYVVTNQ